MGNRKLNGFQTSVEFYNLFFTSTRTLTVSDYLNNSYCDDMAEIDLNKNTFKMIYHVNNKYAPIVSDDGTYDGLFRYFYNNVVHPDDRDNFDDLFNPENVIRKLEISKTKNFRFNHLRYKLQDGTYRWVEIALLTGIENNLAPNVFRMYVFDIQNVKSREEGSENDESFVFNKEIDEVTGIYVKHAFFEKASRKISEDRVTRWCIISMDIEHFKLFDEWYGRNVGDYLLSKIGRTLYDYVTDHNGLCGYMGQDDFIVLSEFNLYDIGKLYDEVKEVIRSFGYSLGFVPAFGVYIIEKNESIDDAFDKASIATYHAKQDIKNKIHVYDPKLHRETEEQYHVLVEFMQALKDNEIQFFLQPQCHLSTGKIVGAEALARWVKKDGTVIPPGVFVPVLEKFSFITDLDQYIWEKVCEWIKSMLNKGIEPPPVSVNVSQVDIYAIDIEGFFKDLVDRFNIEPRYIKIEITESSFAGSNSSVSKLAQRLKKLGFLVMMDDFGSGYSSLSLLSNIDVDCIKLDSQFIFSASSEKGIRVVESVVNMTKLIAVPIVVEGVETKEQCKFLSDLGVRYIQGYYFYKPMPVSKFEELLANEDNFDRRGITVKLNEQVTLKEFLDSDIYSDAMLNNILGPVAYYAWDGNRQIDITRFNQQFYESVDVPDFAERLSHIEKYMPENDADKQIRAFKNAINNKLNGASEVLRYYKTDGSIATYDIQFYYLGYKDGFHRFYGSAKNITQLSDLRQQMRLISKYASNVIVLVKRNSEDNWTYSVAANGLEKVTGIPSEELENHLNNGTLYKVVGEESYEKIKENVYRSLSNMKTTLLSFEITLKAGNKINLNARVDPIVGEIGDAEFIITFWQVDKEVDK